MSDLRDDELRSMGGYRIPETDLPEQVRRDIQNLYECYDEELKGTAERYRDRLTAAFTAQQAEIERLTLDMGVAKELLQQDGEIADRLRSRLQAAEKVAEAAKKVPRLLAPYDELAEAVADWERVKGESE